MSRNKKKSAEETPVEENVQDKKVDEEKKADAISSKVVTSIILDKTEDTMTDKKRSQIIVKFKPNSTAKKFFTPNVVIEITTEMANIYVSKNYGEIVK